MPFPPPLENVEMNLKRKGNTQSKKTLIPWAFPLLPGCNVMAGTLLLRNTRNDGTLVARSRACVMLQTYAAFNCTCLMKGEAHLE